jgi:signal transduction histidine kinase
MTGVIASTPRPTAQLTFARVVTWLASNRAQSWPVILVMLLYPVAIGSIQVPDPSLALPIDTHLYDLLGGAGAAIVLVLGRALARSRNVDGLRIAVNLLIWFLAAVCGTALQLSVATAVGPVPAIFSNSFGFAVLSLMGLMFSATGFTLIYQELKKTTYALAAKRFQLLTLRTNLEDEVAAQRASLNQEVSSRLSTPIAKLISDVEALARTSSDDQPGLGSPTNEIAGQLRQAIDQVIRPLSVEITSDGATIRPTLQTLVQLKKSIRRLPFRERISRLVPLGYIFNVPLTGAMLAVFVLPSFAFILGAEGFWEVALPATAVSLGLIWLLRRATQNLQTYYGFGLFESVGGAVLTSSPYFILGSLVMPAADPGLLLYLTFEAFLINALISYASLFIETSYLNLRMADQSNGEIRKLVAFLQNESQVNRRTMAQVVHGRIQASLQAASIKITQAPNITDELVAEIRADLNQAILDTQDTSLEILGVRKQLADMADQWLGICDLTVSFEGEVEQRLDRANLAKTAVVEVIREGLNNAVKHSEADEADVVVRIVEPGLVGIVIRNAVHIQPAGAQSSNGYGSRMLDQITESWSVEFEDGDAILTATVSLNQ